MNHLTLDPCKLANYLENCQITTIFKIVSHRLFIVTILCKWTDAKNITLKYNRNSKNKQKKKITNNNSYMKIEASPEKHRIRSSGRLKVIIFSFVFNRLVVFSTQCIVEQFLFFAFYSIVCEGKRLGEKFQGRVKIYLVIRPGFGTKLSAKKPSPTWRGSRPGYPINVESSLMV